MIEICESDVLTDGRISISRLKSGWTVTISILQWVSWAMGYVTAKVFLKYFAIIGLCETLFVYI